jgi:transcriptional regulator with XRE-family HTH domain
MISHNIRKRRLDLKLTQAQLAEGIGMSQGYLSELENSVDINPSYMILKRLAEALHTTIDKLCSLPP